jgi:hypothetical protein
MRTLDIELDERMLDAPGEGQRGGVPLRVSLPLRGELTDLGSALLSLRALAAFDRGAKRYPIYRLVRAAARRPLEELFDDLALGTGLAAHRLSEASLLLEGAGVLVSAHGRRKTGYSSMAFAVWAESMPALTAVRDRLLAVVEAQRLREETFTIDWHFLAGQMGLTSATFEELADPPPPDEAYPLLDEPIERFIERYLEAPETILILQGPPGTGKTRFVRAVLAAISRRKGESAEVLYTADTRALENDEIFVEFATGSHDAFVIEDADHLLNSRANGNLNLHRFLTIADGVVRAQGRKILFTTNLPNVGDIDDALLRPGRCFASLRLRALERAEAERLIARVSGSDTAMFRAALSAALPGETRSATLAVIYRAAMDARAAGAPDGAAASGATAGQI